MERNDLKNAHETHRDRAYKPGRYLTLHDIKCRAGPMILSFVCDDQPPQHGPKPRCPPHFLILLVHDPTCDAVKRDGYYQFYHADWQDRSGRVIW